MPNYQRLTDRTLATGVSENDIIHIVITGDTSQNPAGSSYKATIKQVSAALSQREILLASNSGYWSQTENDEDIYVASNFCGWNGCPWNVINEEFPTRLRSNIGVPVPIDILSSGTLKLCGTVSGINEDSENSLTIKLYKYKCSELTGSTFTTTEIASGSTSFTTEGVTCFTLTVSEELLECDTNIVVGFNSDATGGGNRYFTYTLVYNEGIDPL
jgi:hypothetical protein